MNYSRYSSQKMELNDLLEKVGKVGYNIQKIGENNGDCNGMISYSLKWNFDRNDIHKPHREIVKLAGRITVVQ